MVGASSSISIVPCYSDHLSYPVQQWRNTTLLLTDPFPHYSEHALSSGEEAAAIAYIQIKCGDGRTRWGAGVDTNIELASVKAVLSALNRV